MALTASVSSISSAGGGKVESGDGGGWSAKPTRRWLRRRRAAAAADASGWYTITECFTEKLPLPQEGVLRVVRLPAGPGADVRSDVRPKLA